MASRNSFVRYNDLPLYASDEELGPAILGPKRAHLWPQVAKVEEKAGLPRIQHLYGGRYTPGIKAFYDRRYRLLETQSQPEPNEEEGESFNDWKTAGPRAKTHEAKKRSH